MKKALSASLFAFLLASGSAWAGCADQPAQSVQTAQINITASATIVNGLANKNISICAVHVVASAADNIALVEGTGTACATTVFGMAGGATAATGWNLTAAGQVVLGNGEGIVAKTKVFGDSVCLLVSTGAQVSGNITYVFSSP